MDSKLRRIHNEIGRVLLRNWDPLHVADRPVGDPERERYVDEVVQLLAAGASDSAVATHLCAVETRALGYEDSKPGMLRPGVKKLRNLYRRLSATPGAV